MIQLGRLSRRMIFAPPSCPPGSCSPGIGFDALCCRCGDRQPPGPCGASCGEGDAVFWDPFDIFPGSWQTFCDGGSCNWSIEDGALKLERESNPFGGLAYTWHDFRGLSTVTLTATVKNSVGVDFLLTDLPIGIGFGQAFGGGPWRWSFSAPGFNRTYDSSVMPATVGIHYESGSSPWACAWWRDDTTGSSWTSSGPAGDDGGLVADRLTIQDRGPLSGQSYLIDSVCVNGRSVPSNCCCDDWPRDFPLDVTLGGSWDGNEIIDPVFDPYCQRWVSSISYFGIGCDDGLANLEVWCQNPATSTSGLRFNLTSNDPACNPNLFNQQFDLVDCGPPFSADKTIALPVGCGCGPITLQVAEGGSGPSRLSRITKGTRKWIDQVRRSDPSSRD